jgi:hypothetical protein
MQNPGSTTSLKPGGRTSQHNDPSWILATIVESGNCRFWGWHELFFVMFFWLQFFLRTWNQFFSLTSYQCVQLMLLEQIIAQYRHPVAFSKVLSLEPPPSGDACNILLAHLDGHQKIEKSRCILHRRFVDCHPGGR